MKAEDDIFKNMKKLQDLKFSIYELSNRRVDFHSFDILTLQHLPNPIQLDDEFKSLKKDHTIEQIAWSIIKKYDL
ncbi:hypothetical protein [Companilactobacillus nantensis]|uniref:Uncharacterized protein n=1 Tax=Companilactobacillus nantensis DSM 16982 TaxID=1423774 RepID=A0A0R1WJE5_9LACO|nr:hypothetical protein [Companilactobacillus nantensis]KRM17825.1 hypothetical protein FD31_GL002345 [Companilactobacillus nantensis DSM 16982]GEO63525.1 hypothetical protein LNA01_07080 [Companilactobacillus nantensis]